MRLTAKETADRRTTNDEPRTTNDDRRPPTAERRTPNAERRTPNAEPRTTNAERRPPTVAMTLTWLDWLLMLVYFTFVVGVGFALMKKTTTSAAFFQAAAPSRRWSFPASS
jgi:hypothetical protein